MVTDGWSKFFRYFGCAVGIALAATEPAMWSVAIACAHLFIATEN
jgi:hypothetical protein